MLYNHYFQIAFLNEQLMDLMILECYATVEYLDYFYPGTQHKQNLTFFQT